VEGPEKMVEKKRKRNEEWKDTSKGRLFIGKIKDCLKMRIRQPKWSSFEIPIERDALDDWSLAFDQNTKITFSPNFCPPDMTQNIVVWRIRYNNWSEIPLFGPRECKRCLGKHFCALLLNQTTSSDHYLEVSILRKQIWEYESSNVFGKILLPKTLQW